MTPMRSQWFTCLALMVLLSASCGSRAAALPLGPIPEPIINTSFSDRVVALCRDFDRIANRAVAAKVKRATLITLGIELLEHHRPKALSRPIQPVQDSMPLRERMPLMQPPRTRTRPQRPPIPMTIHRMIRNLSVR
jgi:hypothetical protein